MMSNLGFDGAAPDGSARLSAQQVWQSISEVAGQVAALSSLQTTLHSTLHAALVSTVISKFCLKLSFCGNTAAQGQDGVFMQGRPVPNLSSPNLPSTSRSHELA